MKPSTTKQTAPNNDGTDSSRPDSGSERLGVYLQDHFAGSRLAADLLSTMRDRHADEPISRFASELLREVEADRSVLKDLVDRVGRQRARALKEGTAYLIEKLTWLKLRHGSGSALGTLESLETLALGIQGKLALWRALEVVSAADVRLNDVDFQRLVARAEDQHRRVEERRIETAQRILSRAAP